MTTPAIGIARVSQSAGRGGESFVSPGEQCDRIEGACGQEDLRLVPIGDGVRELRPGIADEVDVSGGAALEKRPGLLAAVEAIEAGRAKVLVVAYFDRLVRSLRVQGEVVSRIEAAGGRVLAVDIGTVSEETASKWLSGSMLGLVAEYHRRTAKERSREAQANAVARGVCMVSVTPPGYDRGADGVLVPNDDAPTIAKAFQMRAEGATVKAVGQFLRDHGVQRSSNGAYMLLKSRYYVGEVVFGDLENPAAHVPIVERHVWDAVQAMRVPRGRRPKSPVLLARLGIVRCETCDSRMTVGVSGGDAPSLRCANENCPRRALIRCSKIDPVVIAATKEAIADLKGRASAETHVREAEDELEKAQGALDAAIRAFTGLEGEGAAQKRLSELREQRDAAAAEVEQLRRDQRGIVIGAADWDRLSLDARRDLIQAVIRRATVRPGRGTDRVTVETFGQ